MTIHVPVISMTVDLKNNGERENLLSALEKMIEGEPTLTFINDLESGQIKMFGKSEHQLNRIAGRLGIESKIEFKVGRPQVLYRETIQKKVQEEHKYVRQINGRGHYGHVWLEVEPLPGASGFEFVNKIKEEHIPKAYITAIENGVRETLASAVHAGHPEMDIRVTLLDGSYHDVDSCDDAFKITASQCFKSACKKAGSQFLEPIMKIDVSTPEDYIGALIGDLNRRRATILSNEQRFHMRDLSGTVPLGEILGYSMMLHALTQGRAKFSMEPSHFEKVPKDDDRPPSGILSPIRPPPDGLSGGNKLERPTD
jgi:elongation factor G